MTTVLRFRRRLAVVLALAVTAALVPSGPARASHPVRDGKIAIGSSSDAKIYSLNPDGSDFRELADGYTPDWSPDGRRIAFEVDDATGDHIYTMAADGTDQRPVFADQPGYRDDIPRYAPDGRIVFARCHDEQPEGCALYSVRLDGTGLTAITEFKDGIFDYWQAVAPDGRIAFARFNAGGIQAQVYVANADGSHPQAITDPALLATVPNWSPDGARVTFGSNCCRLGGNVYTVSPRGTHLRQLTHTTYPLNSSDPAYSPSGTRIAFTSNRNHPDRCCTDLYVMSADGTHQTLVLTGLTDVGHVAWGRQP